jgi:hypothetical protein
MLRSNESGVIERPIVRRVRDDEQIATAQAALTLSLLASSEHASAIAASHGKQQAAAARPRAAERRQVPRLP